jgi:hypothetical protein
MTLACEQVVTSVRFSAPRLSGTLIGHTGSVDARLTPRNPPFRERYEADLFSAAVDSFLIRAEGPAAAVGQVLTGYCLT